MSELKQTIVRTCPMCGHVSALRLNNERYEEFRNYCESKSGLIQNLLPNFDVFEREFVKTGYCTSCQSDLFFNDFKDDGTGKWTWDTSLTDEQWEELRSDCQNKDVIAVLNTDKWKNLSVLQKTIVLASAMMSDEFYVTEDGSIKELED